MRCQALSIVLVVLVVTHVQASSFYDTLKGDPKHKLIMRAVESDPQGRLKNLLQQQIPITAFVPTDGAFIKAAMKLRSHGGGDTASVLKNHCLIAAILKQHMVPGLYDTAKLKQTQTTPSMLITKKMVPNTKGKVTVNWPLSFSVGNAGAIQMASAAKTADPSNPKKKIPVTTASLVAPMDIRAGNGLLHNIDGLLLPMTDLARLAKVTGCQTT